MKHSQHHSQERERWLRRHESLSSQRAIYPLTLTQASLRSQCARTARPSTASSRTLPSSRCSSDPSRCSSFTNSSISSSSRRYPRRPRADCPSIPELPKSVEKLPYAPVPPPPAWCPPLRHTPLSADPVIRALSAWKTDLGQAQGQASAMANKENVPLLPKRAPGHSAKTSTVKASTSIARPTTARTSSAHTRMSTNNTHTSSVRTLRRPPSIRYPNRQRLWTFTPSTNGPGNAPGNANGAILGTGLGGDLSVGGMRPSMYSVSSYGTYGTRSSAYTRL